MRIIINADDFGLNASVNQSIIELISCRKITSTTLIANAPSVEQGVQEIPRNCECSFGVHLNLTEFEPLTPTEERENLSICLDGNGHFRGEEHLRSIALSSKVRQAIYNEFRLQVEKILSLGIDISHLDSHHHIHTIPDLFFVIKRLQKHFGIRKVRTTWNVWPSSKKKSLAGILQKRMWDFALRRYYYTKATSAFTSFETFYSMARLALLNHDSMELMAHPGNSDFEEETKLLFTDWQKTIPFSTELISYHTL